MINRRRFLRYGLGGSLLLAAGGGLLSLQGTVIRNPRRSLKMLSPEQFSIFSAVADCLLPGGDGLPPAADLDVVERIDDVLAVAPPIHVEDLGALLALLENPTAGALLDRRPRPFTACDRAAQLATLTRWRHSAIEIRTIGYKALRGLCMSAYYGNPSVYKSIGYPGPPDYGNTRLGADQ